MISLKSSEINQLIWKSTCWILKQFDYKSCDFRKRGLLIILEHDLVLGTCGNSLLRDHRCCSCWRLILDQFLKLLAWFEAWRKWFVVGKVVLPLRFDLSQALCVCLVVFQVCKRVLAVLVWFLCDSRVSCGVFAYFRSVRVDTL